MNISLPDSLKEFVDRQVASAGYGTSSEYVRHLLRVEQERVQLRAMLLEGASAKVVAQASDGYFSSLRKRAGRRVSKARG